MKECEEARQNNEVKIKLEGKKLKLENLQIYLPNNKVILEKTQMEIEEGKYILKGDSGSGKSTIFRTLKGIWPYASCMITFPEKSKIMFIPQKSYMPIGNLKQAIIYPLYAYENIAYIDNLLKALDLGYLKDLMNETNDWHRVLSGGEKQKISIIRSIISKPDILFLDESFSAMDEKSELKVINLLNKELKEAIIILIAHKRRLVHNFPNIINKEKFKLVIE